MANHSNTWVVVADASKASIYSMHKARFLIDENPNNLTLVSTHTHHESRQKTSDLVSDKMGEYGSQSGRNSLIEMTVPKLREAEIFAHELLEQLEMGRTGNHYRDLIIIAPPAFLGLLNKGMTQNLQKLIIQTIEKNYTNDSIRVLAQNLMQHL